MGLSLQDVANAMGKIDRGGISKKESGALEWSLDDVCDFARALGITAGYLIRLWESSL